MHKFPAINTFGVRIPVHNEEIRFSLLLFCGNPAHNKKRQHSYSIIGKIEGLKNIEASAEIISDYKGGNRFKDILHLQKGQFLFSNVSGTPANFAIRLQLQGTIMTCKTINAEIHVRLKYDLQRFLANGVEAKYSSRNITEPVVMLLQ